MKELPRGWPGSEEFPLSATARWMEPQEAARNLPFTADTLFLGTVGNKLIGVRSPQHMATFAASRAGKGISAIVPNLLTYRGSSVNIDLKGELASLTAARRGSGTDSIEGLGQAVHVFDPFRVSTNSAVYFYSSFNPLDRIRVEDPNSIDEAVMIADSLIIQSTRGDPHWTLGGRNVIKFCCLVQGFSLPPGHPQRTLVGVRRLLMSGAFTEKLEGFTKIDPRSEAWAVARDAVLAFLATPEEEQGSILSTARTQTEFLDSPAMDSVLGSSDFAFENLKRRPGSVYLCLPAMRLATHGRWLRLMINCAMEAMERERTMPRDPVLFVLDEFYSMGHMERIEKAAGLMAGYGVKLWTILQDLGQLKTLYRDNFETFLGNAGIVQAFGNTDVTTLEYLSKRLGQITIATATAQNVSLIQQISGQTGVNTARMNTALLQPDEIERNFARHNKNQLVILSGHRPLQLDRVAYFEHPAFRSLAEPDPMHG